MLDLDKGKLTNKERSKRTKNRTTRSSLDISLFMACVQWSCIREWGTQLFQGKYIDHAGVQRFVGDKKGLKMSQ